jgi:hypothetical protein
MLINNQCNVVDYVNIVCYGMGFEYAQWNAKDGVAGGLGGFIGSDYYNSNGITENIEIFTKGEYSNLIFYILPTVGIKWIRLIEFVNAHGFDVSRPQLIYRMILNNTIRPIQ